MVSKKIRIVNSGGLHMRAAAVFVKSVEGFSCNINILHRGKVINAKSILSIMAGCVQCGDIITVAAEGDDEKDALKSALSVIENGFGELS